MKYDARGNSVETVYPDSTVSRTVYDENGRAVVTRDRQLAANSANGTRMIYDAIGRVVRTERLSNVVINVTVDGSGQPTTSLYLRLLLFISLLHLLLRQCRPRSTSRIPKKHQQKKGNGEGGIRTLGTV